MKIYCPRCGQEQISVDARFCSRCGFVMQGLPEIVLTGGVPAQMLPGARKSPTARRRGLKQGGAMFLLGVLVVPMLGVLSSIFRFSDDVVGLAAIVFFLGGIVRMLYALIFESGHPDDKTLEENVLATAQKLMNKKEQAGALPPASSIPVDVYTPPRPVNWRETNDLEPTSVTDSTTKLLQNERK